MMRSVIAKVAKWWSADRPPEAERTRLIREYAQGLMEPERTMFTSWRAGKTTQQISEEMQIDCRLVRCTLAKVYANLRVSLAD